MDRILTLKNTQNNHNTGINLDSWLGNLTAQEPNDSIHLYVELNREGIRKCNSQPWLEPHVKVKDENHGHIDMNIDKKEVDFVSTFFLQLGTNAKVIKPQEVIDNICNQLQDTILHYSP